MVWILSPWRSFLMLHNCIFSPPCRSGPYRSFCVRSPVHIWFSECNVNLWPLILTDSKNDLLGWRCPDPCDWEANKEGFLVCNASIAIESRKLGRTKFIMMSIGTDCRSACRCSDHRDTVCSAQSGWTATNRAPPQPCAAQSRSQELGLGPGKV
jgi:hypothetical protein